MRMVFTDSGWTHLVLPDGAIADAHTAAELLTTSARFRTPPTTAATGANRPPKAAGNAKIDATQAKAKADDDTSEKTLIKAEYCRQCC